MASLFKVRIPETLIPRAPGPPRSAMLTRLFAASPAASRTRASSQRTGTADSRAHRRSMRQRCMRRQRCTLGICPSTPRRSRPTSSSPALARSRRSSWGSTRTLRPHAVSASYCATSSSSLMRRVAFPVCSCAR
jgi:hypothetical protein